MKQLFTKYIKPIFERRSQKIESQKGVGEYKTIKPCGSHNFVISSQSSYSHPLMDMDAQY